MYYSNLIHIGRNDKVLEIGPGGSPFWRSNVLADKFDNSDEVIPGTFGGQKHNTKNKPFFKIVDNRLPFTDNEFDFVICSHVLEHVPFHDLPILTREIFRVAPRAYMEFPSPLYDIIFNFPAHLNFLTIQNSTIYCLSKEFCSIAKYQEYFLLLFKAGVLTKQKSLKRFYTQGAVFFRESFNLERIKDEEKFFRLLALDPVNPHLPTFVNKAYHKIRAMLS
jgi:SAM-dependent methyltransferase